MRLAGIAHGATSLFDYTDQWYQLQYESSDGGAMLSGAKGVSGDGGAALVLRGLLDENADTTKTTAGRGIIEMYAGQESATTWGNVVADGNLLVIRGRTGGAWATRYIFDIEGSAHADVEWTTFDEHDDVALLDSLEASFGEFADDHKAELEALRIASYDDTPGHAMVNWTRLAMLHTGAIRQMSQKLNRYERALLNLGANPALLEA